MEFNEDPQPSSPDEPGTFRFVEVGMRLTYELESLGQIRTSLFGILFVDLRQLIAQQLKQFLPTFQQKKIFI